MFTKARFSLVITLIFLITDLDMIENLAMSSNFLVRDKFVYFLLSLTKKDHSSIAHRITKKKRDLPKIDSV